MEILGIMDHDDDQLISAGTEHAPQFVDIPYMLLWKNAVMFSL